MTTTRARLLTILLAVVLFLAHEPPADERPTHWRDVLAELDGYADSLDKALHYGETDRARELVADIRRVIAWAEQGGAS